MSSYILRVIVAMIIFATAIPLIGFIAPNLNANDISTQTLQTTQNDIPFGATLNKLILDGEEVGTWNGFNYNPPHTIEITTEEILYDCNESVIFRSRFD